MMRLRFESRLARVGRVFLLGVIGAIGVLPGKVSADVPEAKETTMIWSKLSAHWNNGTLPPPYRRSGSVIIHADGRGERHSVRGYDSSGENTVIVPFQLTPGQIDELSRELVRLKAFDTQWKEMDQHPVGGRMNWVTIEHAGGRVSVPPFPVASQAERAGSIHALILNAAPPPESPATQAEEETP